MRNRCAVKAGKKPPGVETFVVHSGDENVASPTFDNAELDSGAMVGQTWNLSIRRMIRCIHLHLILTQVF